MLPSCAAVSSTNSMWNTSRIYLVLAADHEVGELRRDLPNSHQPLHPRLHVRHVATVDERDHGDPLGHRHAVGLVEQLEPRAVVALVPRALDQVVERPRCEKPPSFVRLSEWNSSRRKYSGSA